MARINVLLLFLLISINAFSQYCGSHDKDSICEYEYWLCKRHNRHLKTFGHNNWTTMDKCHPMFHCDILSCKLENDTLTTTVAVSEQGLSTYILMDKRQLYDSTLCLCYDTRVVLPINEDTIAAGIFDPIIGVQFHSASKNKSGEYAVALKSPLQIKFSGCYYTITIPNFTTCTAVLVESVNTFYQTLIVFRKITRRTMSDFNIDN